MAEKEMIDRLSTILPAHTCPKCGKIFYPAPQHVFVDNGRAYCSWTCFNHRKDDKKRKSTVWSTQVERLTLEGKLLDVFPNPEFAAGHVGGTPLGIVKACRGGTKYKKYLWRLRKNGMS